MMTRQLKSAQKSGRPFVVLLASSAILTAGCATTATTAVNPSTFATGATFGGHVHGGNQPVSNSTVQIYTVGQTGVGSSGTLLATATTDASGSFQFSKQTSGSYPNTGSSYTCPSGSDPLLYLVARGGNTTGTGGNTVNNAAAVFLAPLGFCSTVTTGQYVNMSEVTTAAMVAATGQFINPSTEQIGNDGIAVAYQAIAAAFSNSTTLASTSTGLANVSTTLTGSSSGVSAVTVTATPESAKLNTVANILSACINQASGTGGSCATLFSDAAAPNAAYTSQPSATFPTASDTLQAALYMFLNPTDGGSANLSTLYNLSPATGAPYQPTLTSAPSDWTLAIAYSSTSTCGSGSSFLSTPSDLGIDALGNVWIANAGASGALSSIAPNGTPQYCVTLTGNAAGGGQVDVAGNVWSTDATGGNVYRYTPGTNTVRTYSNVNFPEAITTDGSGNVYITTQNGSSVGSVYYIQQGATASGVNTPVQISNIVGPNPAKIFPDKFGNVWVATGTGSVVEVASGSSAGPGQSFLNNFVSTSFTVPSPAGNVNVSASGSVYVTSQDANSTLTVLQPSGGSYAIQSGFPTAANTGGLNVPAGLYLDGASSAWVVNGAANTTSGLYSLGVVSSTGVGISPGGATSGGYQKSSTYLNLGGNLIVDAAGSVWLTNLHNANSLTQLVGAAVPVYQPYSTGISNGRFQTIP